jgi:hypothetical protein
LHVNSCRRSGYSDRVLGLGLTIAQELIAATSWAA